MSEFLFLENDWLYKKYRYLEFVRSEKWFTFKTALNLLLQRNGKLIVETGTMRLHDDPGGGSTLLFGAFCARYGMRLITVDINPLNLKVAMDETKEFSYCTTYVHSDSVEFLKKYAKDVQYFGKYVGGMFNERIDLLYLDSLDCPVEGDATEAQVHNLNEFKAAEPKMPIGSLLLMDDNNFPNGGKPKLTKAFLVETQSPVAHSDGYSRWHCILDWGQSLWERVA